MIREVVNLIGRAASHYRPMPKRDAQQHFAGLQAVVYADAEAPDAALRKQIVDFVNTGGMLITTPDWGVSAATARPTTRPGFRSFTHGKGRIEIAERRVTDPYTFANDAVILVSHKHDLVRLWNAGAHGSLRSTSPDGKRTLAQLLIYSDQAASETTAWVAGQYRSAKLYTIEEPSPRALNLVNKAGGAEMQLPDVWQYAAIELEMI